MASVVHCNCCGVFPSAQRAAFCLSNCGHIFCKKCIDASRLSVKCSRCSAPTPKFVNIDRNLNPNLQQLFKKPSQFVKEHSEELQPAMKFQSAQRTLRFKGQQAQLKHERDKRIELQSQVTTMRDQMKVWERQYNERPLSRSRHSSRDSSTHNLSRAGDISETSSHHHSMSSSVSSNDTTVYLDPFKTPANGLKRFTTSTPKVPPPMVNAKKSTERTMTSRHSSSIPSLSSFSMMDVDDDEIMDVTPALSTPSVALRDTQQLLTMQPSLPSSKSTRMVIDSDPLLPPPSTGRVPPPSTSVKQTPKTPANRKNAQNPSMAARLSAPRPPSSSSTSTATAKKTPQKVIQQPEVTSSTTSRTPATNNKKTAPPPPPCGTPLASSQLLRSQPAPITPIRPINGSQLPSSTVAPAKKPEKTSASSAFKTPAVPVKKISAAPRTMPAGMKTGMGREGKGAAASTVISQPKL